MHTTSPVKGIKYIRLLAVKLNLASVSRKPDVIDLGFWELVEFELEVSLIWLPYMKNSDSVILFEYGWFIGTIRPLSCVAVIAIADRQSPS